MALRRRYYADIRDGADGVLLRVRSSLTVPFGMYRIGGIRTIPTRETPHRGRSAISPTGRTLSMHLRPIVPMGLALIASAGCQSYFPYGYGNTNPYPPMSGTYT